MSSHANGNPTVDEADQRPWVDFNGDWNFDDVPEGTDAWWSNVGREDASSPPPFQPDSPPPFPSFSPDPPPRLNMNLPFPQGTSTFRARDERYSPPRQITRNLNQTSAHPRHSHQPQRLFFGGHQQPRQTSPPARSEWVDRDVTSPDRDIFGVNLGSESLSGLFNRNVDTSEDHFHNYSDYGSFDIGHLLAEDPQEQMPTARNNNRCGSFVDLTDMPSSPPTAGPSTARQPTSLRRAADRLSRPRPNKRKRARDEAGANTGASNHHHPYSDNDPATPIEELDLTATSLTAEEALAQIQQAQLLQSQQQAFSDPTSADPNAPLKLGQRTCIICMEPFTNATVTSCGHMYCHECLTQALLAGEKASDKGVGTCPVCRKAIRRNGKGNAMVPVAFMKGSAFKGKRTRGVAVLG